MLLRSWDDFANVLVQHRIAVVGLDVRGTLARPPRAGNLARAFRGTAPQRLLEYLDARIPQRVRAENTANTTVTDWTLVTVLEFARTLATVVDITSADIAEAVHRIEREYLHDTERLVDDDDLVAFVHACRSRGVRVVVAADGTSARESLLFRTLFPQAWAAIDDGFFTSDRCEGNKQGTGYFAALAASCGIPCGHLLIVGDRLDKDVHAAAAAGCMSVHVSSRSSTAPLVVERFRDLVPTGGHRPVEVPSKGHQAPR